MEFESLLNKYIQNVSVAFLLLGVFFLNLDSIFKLQAIIINELKSN